MTGPLVVALDGSSFAERVLPYATRLRRPLVLVRAWPRLDLTRLLAPDVAASAQLHEHLAHQQAEQELETSAERLRREAGVEVSTVLQDGASASVILDVARSHQAHAIALATHGRSAPGRWLYGSVAEDVLRQSDVPALLVSPTCHQTWADAGPRRILVPLDGSSLAEEAVAPAAELAAHAGAEIVLLQVVPLPSYTIYGEVGLYVDFGPEQFLAEAQTYLEGIARRLQVQGVPSQIETRVGAPAVEVAVVAHECGADLIALATHGRTGLARLVLGSVATSILQSAAVPLWLMRPTGLARVTELPTTLQLGEEPQRRLVLNAAEVSLLERGLGMLAYAPGADPAVSEPARHLRERLHQLEATPSGVTSGGATRV